MLSLPPHRRQGRWEAVRSKEESSMTDAFRSLRLLTVTALLGSAGWALGGTLGGAGPAPAAPLGAAPAPVHVPAPLARARPGCQPVTQAEVAGLFARWNASLQTKDPRRVAANYEPDAVLLPTVSNHPRVTPEGIQDYFAHWLPKGPEGRIVYSHVKLGCNMATDAGVYEFTYDNGDKVTARYSFIYTYDPARRQWLIWNHHSSAMPHDLREEADTEF